jgi:hypothetical protein
MRAVVVGGLELELNPCRGNQRPALEPAFEGGRERDEDRFTRVDPRGFEGMSEVGSGGAVAVPEVVIEEVCAGFDGLVS